MPKPPILYNILMRTAIIDDQETEAEQTYNLLTTYCAKHSISFECSRFTNGEDFLQFILENQTNANVLPELIFMDIEMPGLNGMDTARKIREAGNESVLIFTTRLAQYATHGYEVDAIGYLLKPLDQYSFAMRMKKAMYLLAATHENSSATFSLNYRGKTSQIKAADVYYAEVKGHYCIYYTTQGTFEVKESLITAAEKLNPLGNFFACSRFYLINLNHVTTVQGYEVYFDHATSVKVSRLKKSQLIERLGSLS